MKSAGSRAVRMRAKGIVLGTGPLDRFQISIASRPAQQECPQGRGKRKPLSSLHPTNSCHHYHHQEILGSFGREKACKISGENGRCYPQSPLQARFHHHGTHAAFWWDPLPCVAPIVGSRMNFSCELSVLVSLSRFLEDAGSTHPWLKCVFLRDL